MHNVRTLEKVFCFQKAQWEILDNIFPFSG